MNCNNLRAWKEALSDMLVDTDYGAPCVPGVMEPTIMAARDLLLDMARKQNERIAELEVELNASHKMYEKAVEILPQPALITELREMADEWREEEETLAPSYEPWRDGKNCANELTAIIDKQEQSDE